VIFFEDVSPIFEVLDALKKFVRMRT